MSRDTPTPYFSVKGVYKRVDDKNEMVAIWNNQTSEHEHEKYRLITFNLSVLPLKD